ncbi:hypothetical protein RJ639_006730 [Escallonia herrerae]|uniref:RRM domain-containing protein n=1 Tax=Escallonia herrerae TaxID=1293975 RepID=A0AA89AYE8_9ASTE|nr:hypothetical protein RJ639_006730 [Escallonia herrerae]
MAEQAQHDDDDTITATSTRIYVGGLGSSVTEDDLRNTFSSLGKLESVEIVRTKGRSFAYLDFLPSSPKSLPKLFSTYNGCMWKGGKLKLEKAKEHFLIRLQRERSEIAELTNLGPCDSDASENMLLPEKSKKIFYPDTTHLRIFFPKLKKMMSLPCSGTGKHKYSFQRIVVPFLPVHFCDCEEHSVPSNMSKEKPAEPMCHVQASSTGVNEEEINMMESVMNKLFQRNNPQQVECNEVGLAKEGASMVGLNDDQLVDENKADDVSDEDNLVLNMVTGENNITSLIASKGQERTLKNQEPMHNEQEVSKKFQESQRKKIVSSDKKRKYPLAEQSDKGKDRSAMPERKKNMRIHWNEAGDQSMEQQSTDKYAWSQKSSWKDLVGKKNQTPFQISQIMPTVHAMKEDQTTCDDLSDPNSRDMKNQNLVRHRNLEHSEELKELAEAPIAILNAVSDKLTSERQLYHSKEPKKLPEALPAIPNTDLNKKTRGASWLKEASWTQMVRDASSSSFSISDVLPGLTFPTQEISKPSETVAAKLEDGQQQNLLSSRKEESMADYSAERVAYKESASVPFAFSEIVLAEEDQNYAGTVVEQTTPERILQTVRERGEVCTTKFRKTHHTAPKQASIRDVGVGETCTFMRNAASMKEWTKTKAALSGSLKKKGSGKYFK